MDADHTFMREALTFAHIADSIGEIPVGCVIVRDNAVIASGVNRRESDQCAVNHAEIIAIRRACEVTGFWRLDDCDLYVTLEPCPMCAGAIVNARIRRLIYGAPNMKSGAFGTKFDLNAFGLNHRPEIIGGIMRDECADLLKNFSARLRKG
ncbi:tRNA-specific adenosine deaminase [Clostridia bacterium]|nr:tRNA-specific adenosine deaminase [Clostridia bacterium]